MHPLQIGMETSAVVEALAVSRQDNRDARVPVVVSEVAQHLELEHAVGTLLLATLHCAPIEQLDLYPFRTQPVPESA